MNPSTRLLPRFGLSLLFVLAVSCAQPGARDGVSPTSPSSLSGGTSPSSVDGPLLTAAGPSAGYDASGTWCITNTDANGNPDGDPFETSISQDPATGNLSLTDEDGESVTLERLSNGQGRLITYRISIIGSEGGTDCDIRVKGTLQLDTTTNTITGNIRFKELGCSNARGGAGVIGRKGSCPAL